MNLPLQYAYALQALIEKEPQKAKEYLHTLEKVLVRRGHQKLLPRVFAAYLSIEEKEQRTKRYREHTPGQERTRVLIELYRTLIATP